MHTFPLVLFLSIYVEAQDMNTEVVCHSLLQWTTVCQNFPARPVHLGWPYTAWLSFTELDKAVVRVIRLASCDCGFSLSALWCPLSVPTLFLGFLLPWTWGISSRLLHQSAAAAPYLGRGVAPLGHAPAPSQCISQYITFTKTSFYENNLFPSFPFSYILSHHSPPALTILCAWPISNLAFLSLSLRLLKVLDKI